MSALIGLRTNRLSWQHILPEYAQYFTWPHKYLYSTDKTETKTCLCFERADW